MVACGSFSYPPAAMGGNDTVYADVLTRNKMILSKEVSGFHYNNHLKSDCKVEAILRAIQSKYKSERIPLALTLKCVSRAGTLLGC